MNKIVYKNKWLTDVFWLVFGIIFFLIGLFSLKTELYIIPFGASLLFFVCFFDKFELDISSGQIKRKIFGITVMRLNIKNIKKYLIKFIAFCNGYGIPGSTYIEVEIFKNERRTCKAMNTLVDLTVVGKMFLEAKKINMEISKSNTPFCRGMLRKKFSTIYSFLLLIAVIFLAIYIFINIK